MRTYILFAFFFVLQTVTVVAQIRVPSKVQAVQQNTTIQQTNTKTPVTQNATNVRNQVNNQLASNMSTSFTMPDGNRLNVELKRNPVNYPQQIGGVVKENIFNQSQQQSANENCTIVTKSISAQSTTFMNVTYSQSTVQIYPGAIYNFTDFFSGNFRPVNQSRNPIVLRSDNLANTQGPVTRSIANPDENTIPQAIQEIVQPFSSTAGAADLQFRIFQSENDADMAIKLSAGGGYAGFKAKGGFSFNDKARRIYLTVDVVKPMYTLTASAGASGYISDQVLLGNNPQLIAIQSVTYGTRILANVEIVINSNEDAANFEASFGKEGVSFNASLAFEYLKNTKSVTSTVNGYVLGGPVETTIFSKTNLLEEITALLKQCNYKNARPIIYSFADMKGNIMGVESATDKFVDRDCTPVPLDAYVTGVSMEIMTTEKKEQGSNVLVEFSKPPYVLLFESNQNNVEFSSTNSIVLNRRANVYTEEFNVKSFAQNGGYMDVFLEPRQIGLDWDSWKINTITVRVTMKDKNGNPLPEKTLSYNVTVTLQKDQQRLRLPFDGNFTPGTPFLVGL